jgi:hypothetical protein
MDRACSMYGREDKLYGVLVGKPERKTILKTYT